MGENGCDVKSLLPVGTSVSVHAKAENTETGEAIFCIEILGSRKIVNGFGEEQFNGCIGSIVESYDLPRPVYAVEIPVKMLLFCYSDEVTPVMDDGFPP